ncbi:MAG: O-antigen ligase family protein [Oscillospiraceae bacterium]
MDLRAKLEKFSREKLMLVLGVYILCQPLIDVLTSLGANAGHPVTAGVAVRSLFMVACVLYAVLVSRFPGKKRAMVYIGALVGYLALFMLYMLSIGGFSLCIANVPEVVKTFFAPFVLVFLYCIYKQYGFTVTTGMIGVAGGLYASVILVALLTGTSNVSYANSSNGFNGWFFAANEVSCIIALTAPFTVCLCVRALAAVTKKTWWKGALAVWTLAAVAVSANFIGTKIVFAVTALYCVAAFVWAAAALVRERSKTLLVQTVVLGVLCAVVIGMFFRSPLRDYLNNIYLEIMDEDSELRLISWGEEIQKASEGTWLKALLQENETWERVDQILSRRLLSASPSIQVYTEGGVLAKLLGIGYADCAAYSRSIEFMVEMDPLGILVRHGIIGFAVYCGPYLAFIGYAIVQFFKRSGQRLSSLDYCTALYSVLIGFAISTIAGHALVSPAVSTFMLVTGMQLWAQTQEQNRLPKPGKG